MAASSPTALVGTFDDIIFAGRNQAYGAFQLRRSYSRHLSAALAITVAALALLLLVPLVLRYFMPEMAVVPPIVVDGGLGYQPIDAIIERPVVPPAAAGGAPAAVVVRPHTEILTQIEADPKVTFTPKPTDSPIDNGLNSNVPGPATATGTEDGRTAPGGTGGTGPDSAAPAVAAPGVLPTYVERMPTFAGGQEALRRYLQNHLRQPGAALANQVSGKVYLTFVVGADGAISDVKVIRDLGYGTGEAAARAVREMPAWVPGMQNKRTVPVRCTLPISFQYE